MWNKKLRRFNLGLEESEEPEIKLPASLDDRESKGIPEKTIYFCFINYTKAFNCVDHSKLENSQRDGSTRPPHLSPEEPICLSRRNGTGDGEVDWFKTGKGVCKGYLLSPGLFN